MNLNLLSLEFRVQGLCEWMGVKEMSSKQARAEQYCTVPYRTVQRGHQAIMFIASYQYWPTGLHRAPYHTTLYYTIHLLFLSYTLSLLIFVPPSYIILTISNFLHFGKYNHFKLLTVLLPRIFLLSFAAVSQCLFLFFFLLSFVLFWLRPHLLRTSK